MEILNDEYDISVIVPTYNRSILLSYTLQTLLLQNTNKSRYEVIVADDGSSDDTRSVVKKFEDRLHIKYIFQEDRGYRPASARNMGIRIARGRVCVFLDSGIIADQDCLNEHIQFHQNCGPDVASIGYIYGLAENEEANDRLLEVFDPENPAAIIPVASESEIYFDVRERHFRLHNDQIHLLPAPWSYFWSGHISVSRANLFKVGVFDEDYDGKWGIEDNDLGFRLHQAGIRIYLVRSARSIHYPHHTCKPDKEVQGLENCVYFHRKFQTLETGLFLKHFATTEFVDINSISLQLQNDLIQK